MDQNTRQEHEGGSPWSWCQQNVRVFAKDNIGQITKDTPTPRKQIKIPDFVGNRIRAARLEGRESTDHAIATEVRGHPPYSPDLSPCDYAIFDPLIMALRSKRFTSDDDVKQYVWNWITTQPREFYEAFIRALCRSGTSARANTSDIQVLVSVPRPPARFFFNASQLFVSLCKNHSIRTFSTDSFCRHLWSRCPWNTSR